MKLFTGSHAIVPSPWIAALGEPAHIRQATVAVVAKTKRDAGLLTGDAGSWRMIDELRMVRGPVGNDIEMLLAAGVISSGTAGIWAWAGAVKDRAVIRVDGGRCEVVARWRYAGGALSVEAVT